MLCRFAHQYPGRRYWMSPRNTCINPAFNGILALLNSFLVGLTMSNTSWKFRYCDDVHTVFFTPLNDHGVMLILTVHSCTSFNLTRSSSLTSSWVSRPEEATRISGQPPGCH